MKALKITAAVLYAIPLMPFILLGIVINLTGDTLVVVGEGIQTIGRRFNYVLTVAMRFGKNIIWGVK